MATCGQCQFENPLGMRFCGQCGAPLAPRCPQCGTEVPPQFKFCGQCGASLASGAPTTPAASATASASAPPPSRPAVAPPAPSPSIAGYTPKHLADKILKSRSALEGERRRITALFGAPIGHEDSPRRAVHAALGIQRALRDYAKELESQRGLTVQMRIGLNTGPVVVGRIGDDLRMDYTAVGDTTNL